MPFIFPFTSIFAAPCAQARGSFPDFRIAELTMYVGKNSLPNY